MFKEVIIRKSVLSIGVCSVLLLTSCGGASNKDADAANALLTQAEAQLNSNNFSDATMLLDSLKSAYPKDIEALRKAMHIRTLISEKTTLLDIQKNDSILTVNSQQKDALAGKFTFIKTPQMVEGYYVLKTAQKRPLIQRTGIEARIDEQGNMYLLSLLSGKAINHTQLSVSSSKDGVAKTDNVPYNGSTNYRFKNEGVSNEMITFRATQCDTLNQFVVANKDANLKLTFIGKSSYSIPLPTAEKNMIVDTYIYSKAVQESKKAEAQKLFLDNKLKIAREQIKKTAIK